MKKDHSDTTKQAEKENRHEAEDLEPEDIFQDKSAQESTGDSADETEALPNVLEEELAKLKEDYLRVLAEAENIKKRCTAEIEKNNKYAVTSFAKDMLAVADNLDRALEAGKSDTQNADGILQGVSLTRSELAHVFSKFGIEPMDVVGQIFDPNYHRVVQELADPSKPAGTVVAELQKGYMINGRLLREAMVIVTKTNA